jgi:hypothetical protein
MLCIKKVMFKKFYVQKMLSLKMLCLNFEIIYVVTRAGHALFLGLRAATLLGRTFLAGSFALFFWP